MQQAQGATGGLPALPGNPGALPLGGPVAAGTPPAATGPVPPAAGGTLPGPPRQNNVG
jgi:heme-binding protein